MPLEEISAKMQTPSLDPDSSANQTQHGINIFPPGKELTVIESGEFLSSIDLKGIWHYRELLYFLALRDIKIRYKQTLLGIAWVVFQPVITTLVFTAIFLRLGSVQDLSIPYPLFAFSGFTLWTFISSAIMNCSNSLLNHSSLITKVYFPRLVIPFSAVLATLVDLFFGFISLILAMAFYNVFPQWQILLLPILMIPVLLFALGIGIFTAAINVKYRDVKYILPFLIQLLFFISPIFYSLSMLPQDSVWLWYFNPVTGFLENFRAILFGLSLNWYSLIISAVFSFAVFLLSVFVFHRMEDDFADVI
jgi:lipopolysaccharide transport system permease protein